MVAFAGWSLPLHYGSAVEEVRAVRTAAGLFDVSHLGQLTITGSRAGEFLDGLLTNHVRLLPVGRANYHLLLNEVGGTLDDLVLLKLSPDAYELIVNAVNTEADRLRLEAAKPAGVVIRDRTSETCRLALQGPRAAALLTRLTRTDLAHLGQWHFVSTLLADRPALISRTGYTGEDGFEILARAADGLPLWEALAAQAKPAGLAARDLLRLEAGLCLWGQDLTPDITPLEARLDFAVRFDKHSFIGREALRRQRDQGPPRERIGLEVAEPNVPRAGGAIQAGGEQIGVITSGNHSPTLEHGIAMGYVWRGRVRVGDEVAIDIRGESRNARVAALPFVKPR